MLSRLLTKNGPNHGLGAPVVISCQTTLSANRLQTSFPRIFSGGTNQGRRRGSMEAMAVGAPRPPAADNCPRKIVEAHRQLQTLRWSAF